MSHDWWNGYAVGTVVMAALRMAVDLTTIAIRRRVGKTA